jgi:DNA repair protein RadC
MKQNSKEVYETTALGYLGGRTRAVRTALRELPHEIIDRGRRSQARLYQVANVMALLRSRSEKFRQELLALKELDTQRQVCRAKLVSIQTTAPSQSLSKPH